MKVASLNLKIFHLSYLHNCETRKGQVSLQTLADEIVKNELKKIWFLMQFLCISCIAAVVVS